MKKLFFLSVFVFGLSLLFISCNFTHPVTPFELSVGYKNIPESVVNYFVVDTFEDGDQYDNNGGTWLAVNDVTKSGNSTASMKMTNDSFEGTKAIYFEYTLGSNYDFRFALLTDNYGIVKDFTQYSNITFSIKGSGNPVRLMLATTTITDAGYYGYNISAPSTWTTETLWFKFLSQPGWATNKPLELDHVREIQFQASSQVAGEHGWFIIDNVRLNK